MNKIKINKSLSNNRLTVIYTTKVREIKNKKIDINPQN